MISAIFLISTVTGWVSAPSARAYNLGDHKRVMLQAISEINACFPGLVNAEDELVLWTSDLDEDIDMVRKDFVYSHYFNPYKHLNMSRYDSSVRVSALENALLEDAAQGEHDGFIVSAHLGHAIHHLQDATVPAHVVPVQHWLTDGFELYDFKGDISSGLNCAELVAHSKDSPDLESLLVSTAKETLQNMAALSISILRDKAPIQVGSDSFWLESTNNDFGQYGELGNHFGSASFQEQGVNYTVPHAQTFYSQFKQGQLKLAVRTSVRALYWFLIVHGGK